MLFAELAGCAWLPFVHHLSLLVLVLVLVLVLLVLLQLMLANRPVLNITVNGHPSIDLSRKVIDSLSSQCLRML